MKKPLMDCVNYREYSALQIRAQSAARRHRGLEGQPRETGLSQWGQSRPNAHFATD